jgi:choline kinase
LAQIGIQFMEDVGQDTGHWWGASLLSTISNNIQVHILSKNTIIIIVKVRIENIQIKYECMEYEFGIKIQSLAIETTNAQWVRIF